MKTIFAKGNKHVMTYKIKNDDWVYVIEDENQENIWLWNITTLKVYESDFKNGTEGVLRKIDSDISLITYLDESTQEMFLGCFFNTDGFSEKDCPNLYNLLKEWSGNNEKIE